MQCAIFYSAIIIDYKKSAGNNKKKITISIIPPETGCALSFSDLKLEFNSYIAKNMAQLGGLH